MRQTAQVLILFCVVLGAGCTTTAKKSTSDASFPATDVAVSRENENASHAREASKHGFWHSLVVFFWGGFEYGSQSNR
jgi:hypothetical protein